MLASFAFDLELRDGSDRLDPRVWRALVTCALAQTGEGLAVCDAELGVLFATPRAVHLLGRLGMGPERALPESVTKVVNEQIEQADVTRTDRVSAVRGATAMTIRACALNGAPPAHVAIWVREEILRDDRLYAALRERFRVTPRRFQLAQLVKKGLTNRQIAEHLRLTESTVKVYLHELYRDCGVASRTALVALFDRWSS